MKKQLLRIFLGTTLPPLLGSLQLLIISFFIEDTTIAEILESVVFIVAMAYVFMGIQSFVYSLIMEFCIFRFTNSPKLVLPISIALSFIAGLLIPLNKFFFDFLSPFPYMGAVTGLFVGYILLRHVSR